jgi:cobalamin synthase
MMARSAARVMAIAAAFVVSPVRSVLAPRPAASVSAGLKAGWMVWTMSPEDVGGDTTGDTAGAAAGTVSLGRFPGRK